MSFYVKFLQLQPFALNLSFETNPKVRKTGFAFNPFDVVLRAFGAALGTPLLESSIPYTRYTCFHRCESLSLSLAMHSSVTIPAAPKEYCNRCVSLENRV